MPLMHRIIGLLTLLTFYTAILAKESEKSSTAANNVQVLEQVMMIPGLDRERTIRLYLPPNYTNSEKRYPVLYMHDGQNLFDVATAYAGEWKIDESLNQLASMGQLELIVVGIDNGAEKRMNELSPWENHNFGEAEGEAYVGFIVNTVKPFIDKTYRTETAAQHTAIMGSSMGGLISHYAIHQYPEVFSKAGVFSPSFWYSDQVFSHTKANTLTDAHSIYMIASYNEGEEMSGMMLQMAGLLEQHPNRLFAEAHTHGDHNEAYWAGEFSKAILWLFEK